MLDLQALAEMDYPGRFILVSSIDDDVVAVAYGVTGRRESSQARKLVATTHDVRIVITDEELIKKGNLSLLVYRAMSIKDGFLVVSNGAQTDVICERIGETSGPPSARLHHALSKPCWRDGINLTSYEPDEPNWTPRISGLIELDGSQGALISVWRHEMGETVRGSVAIRPLDQPGVLIPTYTGENKNPLPSYTGPPKQVLRSGFMDGYELADQIWDDLNPDFRVAVAVATLWAGRVPIFTVRNRHD